VLCLSLPSSHRITTTLSGHLRGRRAPEPSISYHDDPSHVDRLALTRTSTTTGATTTPDARPAITLSHGDTTPSAQPARPHRAPKTTEARPAPHEILVSRSPHWSVTRPASLDLFGSAAITSAAAVSSSSSAAAPAEPRFQPQWPDPAAQPVHQPRQSATPACSKPPRTPSRVRTPRPRPPPTARPVKPQASRLAIAPRHDAVTCTTTSPPGHSRLNLIRSPRARPRPPPAPRGAIPRSLGSPDHLL
jgi:hypothetical protein